MRKAQYTDGQFLDANGLNYISTDALASDQQAASVWALPGLINPSLITFAAGSGLNAQVTFGSGSLVQFSSGVIAQGLGVSSGSTSNIYNVDLTPFVPAAGSQVVNLYASHFDLPLTQTTISGPPPGNPAYNAGFVPFTAYQETVDSLAVSAMTGVPDGITQVFLASCTLSAGESVAPTSYTVSGQSLASKISTSQYASLTANKTLTASDAGIVQNVSGAISVTLPAAGNVPGLAFFLSNVGSSAATLQANGSDSILGLLGYRTTASSGPIPASSQIAVRSDGQRWQVLQNAGAPPIVWTGAPSPLSISASGGISSPYTFSGSGSASGTTQLIPRTQGDQLYSPWAQSEAVISAVGLTPDRTNTAQLLAAIEALFSQNIYSELIAASTTTNTVSLTFSFTPKANGKLSIFAQGGSSSNGTALSIQTSGWTPSVSQENIATTLLAINWQQGNLTAGTTYNITITQTTNASSVTSNNLSANFVFLPN